jgi:PIN domain nuclease of toxin-antitoxin system
VTAYLLDTNAFAMMLTDDPRLPPGIRERLVEATRVAVSAICFYEIGQKVRLGRWPQIEPHVAGLDARARDDGYDILSLTPAAALEASTMDWPHRDPFDRMIATVARHEGLPLISSDSAFDALGIARLWT